MANILRVIIKIQLRQEPGVAFIVQTLEQDLEAIKEISSVADRQYQARHLWSDASINSTTLWGPIV